MKQCFRLSSLITAAALVWVLWGGQVWAAPPPSAFLFMPRQAPLVVSLEQGRRLPPAIASLPEFLLKPLGVDYQAIPPWAGPGVALGLTSLDADHDPTNGRQPGYLLAAPVESPERARRFLVSLARAGATPVAEDLAGVTMKYYSSLSLAWALVADQFVLVANHPQVLRDALTAAQAPGLNLQDYTPYQEAYRGLSHDPQLILYSYLPQAFLALGAPSPAPYTYPSLVAGVWQNRQHLGADLALLAAAVEGEVTPAPPAPLGSLKYLPQDSFLVAAGQHLDRFWPDLDQTTRGYPGLQNLVFQEAASLEKRWGLNLAEDILAWNQGEYAFALLPRGASIDWLLVTPSSPAVTAALEGLGAKAQAQGYSFSQIPQGDQVIAAWTRLNPKGDLSLETQVGFGHLQYQGYELLSNSLPALVEALQSPSLTDSPRFRAAIAPLTGVSGYLHLDWTRGREPILHALPVLKLARLLAPDLFKHLGTMTLGEVDHQGSGVRWAALSVELAS